MQNYVPVKRAQLCGATNFPVGRGQHRLPAIRAACAAYERVGLADRYQIHSAKEATERVRGATFALDLTDTVTLKAFSHAFMIGIPSTAGGNTAHVGVTARTGGYPSIQNIKTGTFISSDTQTAAGGVFNPLPGVCGAPQQVLLSSTTVGATI